MIQALDHIGIAVHDIDTSLALYKSIFQLNDDAIHRERVEDQGVDIASFLVGSVRLELTAAINESSPIAQFLAKRGEGIHHLAFRSSDVGGDLSYLGEHGIRLINQHAVPGAHEMLIAFLHPKSTGGVLMELCQPAKLDH